jgi:biopolymer transport protein ExbB/TolQ
VYAFITRPLADYVAPRGPAKDPIKSNVVGIILGSLFGIAGIAGALYWAFRLFRYRKKYHDQRAEADMLKEEVNNMTQFGADGGTRDQEVAMTQNPLAQQLAHLQQAVKEEDIKLQEAETHLRQQEADIRQEHIQNMRSNRDHMLAELEKLKAQLQQTTAAPVAASTYDDTPATTGAAWDQPQAGYGDTSYDQQAGGGYRTQFEQSAAPVQPKRRNL